MIWFQTLLTHLLKGLRDRPGDSLSSVGRHAYNHSIAPFHNVFLRNAIRLVFFTVPSRKHFITQTYGPISLESFNSILSQILQPLEPLVAYLWQYYKDRGLTTLE